MFSFEGAGVGVGGGSLWFLKWLPLCRVCKRRHFLKYCPPPRTRRLEFLLRGAPTRRDNVDSARAFWRQAVRVERSRMSVPASALKAPLCSCLSAQYVTCDTKLRDQCKGTPCNRCGSDKNQRRGLESTAMFNRIFPSSSDTNAPLVAWMLWEKWLERYTTKW